MNAACLLVCGVLVLPFAAPGAAFGHGGFYPGPSPTLPPNFGGPGTGPNSGPGALPGGPGGLGPVTPGAKGAASGLALMTRRAAVPSGWTVWWEFNKAPYLDLRGRLGSSEVQTGLGRSGVPAEGDGNAAGRPGFEALLETVIPVLKQALQEDDTDIVDSAVLALARITPGDRGALVAADILETLGHKERSAKQSAILALGVLGDRAAVPVLLELLRGAPAARERLKIGNAVDESYRALAAISLGLLGDPATIGALGEELAKARSGDDEMTASIVSALGLFRDRPEESVGLLRPLLAERRLADVVRAQAPIALWRLGGAAAAVVPELAGLLKSRKTPDALRSSAAIALGKLAAPEDREVLDLLIEAVEGGTNEATAAYAILAVGEIGARAAADPVAHAKLLEDVERIVIRQLVRPRKKTAQPFAATACALLARAHPADSEARGRLAKKLLEAFEDTNNPDLSSAIAIGLGLIQDPRARKPLEAALDRAGDKGFRFRLIEAIGMLGDSASAPVLQERLAGQKDAEERVALAVGLGLLGDPTVSELLTGELKKAKTLLLTVSIAEALGQVGDRSALQALVKLVQDESRPGIARGFGCVALGLIGEKLPLPWNSRLAFGFNDTAPFYTLSEVLDIL